MSPTTLLALTLVLPPGLPLDPAPYLPTEQVCEAMHGACQRDIAEINRRLEIVGGWQAEQLRGALAEAERLRLIWWAAWWIRWTPPPGYCSCEDAREEQADWLIWAIGSEAYWRGEIPLPLSLRR